MNRELKELNRLLCKLPPGRRRVARALIADAEGRTYTEVAATLELHLGTVSEHLRRIRIKHSKVYASLMKIREVQLAGRHERALNREKERSKLWHQMTRGFYLRIFH